MILDIRPASVRVFVRGDNTGLMRSIRTDKSAPLLVALLVIAIVAFVLPTCLASACGMSMTGGMSLADLLTCDSMYLPQDVPGAVLVAAAAVFAAIIAAFLWAPMMAAPVISRVVGVDPSRSSHDPPGGDTLFGRLRL